ncbi:hypothetical protein Tco_0684548 [Tanacetum coccineum]
MVMYFSHDLGHPSWTFRRCSSMDLGTLFMSANFQANMSRLFLSTSKSSIIPFSDRLPPIVIVCSGYSGVCLGYSRCIATFIPSTAIGSLGGSSLGASAIILHSAGIMVLLCSVTIPSFIGNLSIPDRTTTKFIRAFVECSSSPRDTISDICLPLNPNSEVVVGVIRLLTSGRSLLKKWLSCPSQLVSGGNDISWFAEKL